MRRRKEGKEWWTSTEPGQTTASTCDAGVRTRAISSLEKLSEQEHHPLGHRPPFTSCSSLGWTHLRWSSLGPYSRAPPGIVLELHFITPLSGFFWAACWCLLRPGHQGCETLHPKACFRRTQAKTPSRDHGLPPPEEIAQCSSAPHSNSLASRLLSLLR